MLPLVYPATSIAAGREFKRRRRSERAGKEVGIFETARDYIDTVLATKPEEAVAAPPEVPDEDIGVI